ncbi:MAG TPA: thioesterase domain-containing protein, partial [Casimicrobiaceae bacterium]|nr:thioesterase domain-containing protein [Casimicrobiaceae bacterium]
DRLTRNRNLRQFVLFSSVSATVGNFGQATYAAANAALDELARKRRAAGLHATAIEWGMLGEAGYVAERRELVESLTQMGLMPLSNSDVCDALDIALASEESVLVAARLDWQRLARRFAGHHARSNVISHLLSSAAGASAPEATASAGQSIRAADPADRPALIAEYVRKTAARVLGMPPAKISTERPLAEMGLDSLMGVELAGQIEGELGVAFPMSALGHEITIGRIADTICNALGGTAQPVDARVTPAVSVAASAATAADADGCVVQLSGGEDRPPLFCFHPAGGDLTVYSSVAKQLAEKYRVVGIQSRVLGGAAHEFASLDEMAAAYADVVQKHNPRGPHHLFGFSFGGLLALHTARVLLDRGAAVGWVGLAETPLQWSATQEYADVFAAFLVELYERMRDELEIVKELPADVVRTEMRSLAETLMAQPQVGTNGAATPLLMEWLSARGYLRENMPRGLLEEYLGRVAAHLGMLPRDRPCPTLDVPLHVWQAADGFVVDSGAWHAITRGPVQVRTVESRHFEMMTPPHSHLIAAELSGLMAPGAPS